MSLLNRPKRIDEKEPREDCKTKSLRASMCGACAGSVSLSVKPSLGMRVSRCVVPSGQPTFCGNGSVVVCVSVCVAATPGGEAGDGVGSQEDDEAAELLVAAAAVVKVMPEVLAPLCLKRVTGSIQWPDFAFTIWNLLEPGLGRMSQPPSPRK